MLVSEHQYVALHTFSGVPLWQWLPNDILNLAWSRELSEVSRCETEVAITDGSIPDVVPWLHWVSVWDETGTDLYWTGPVQKATYRRGRLKISARDAGSLMSRTRCPITKSWESADPAEIALELWQAMWENHRLRGEPMMRRDPLHDPFDFEATADSQMLDKVMDDLVGLGLCWSVTAGVPVLGPAPRTPLVALGEDDFMDDGLSLVRDGQHTINDVLVRGADDSSRARVKLGDLNLQGIVNINSLFGVSNADRAARQFLRYCSTLRDAVTVDDGVRLHPYAPLTSDQLVPSTRMTVEAYGVLSLMELRSVEVRVDVDGPAVSVNLESVDDFLPELITVTERDGSSR